MLVKVLRTGASYQALAEKSFTVYTDSRMTKVAKGIRLNSETGAEEQILLSGLTSGAGGAFFIGYLNFGKYYVKEEGINDRHFEFAVDENGVIAIEDYGSDDSVSVKTVELISNT